MIIKYPYNIIIHENDINGATATIKDMCAYCKANNKQQCNAANKKKCEEIKSQIAVEYGVHIRKSTRK